MNRTFDVVDINNEEHCAAVLSLLNDYMEDKMGMVKAMPEKLGPEIINGLRKHKAYLGFFVKVDGNYAALANCNLNYSTWQAKFLINIHDFVVSPSYRKQGIGHFLLSKVDAYAKQNDYCKLTLEVREDNIEARNLYAKIGFVPTKPRMSFIQKAIK